MTKRPINPYDSAYAQAHEVSDAKRILFISGQIPVAAMAPFQPTSNRNVDWRGLMCTRNLWLPG